MNNVLLEIEYQNTVSVANFVSEQDIEEVRFVRIFVWHVLG